MIKKAKLYALLNVIVAKFNPNHDKLGRFASSGSGGRTTVITQAARVNEVNNLLHGMADDPTLEDFEILNSKLENGLVELIRVEDGAVVDGDVSLHIEGDFWFATMEMVTSDNEFEEFYVPIDEIDVALKAN